MRLPVTTHYEYLRRLRVPDGIFLPGKASTRKLEISEPLVVDETTPSWPANAEDDHIRRRTDSNKSQGTEHSSTSSSPRSSASPEFDASLPVASPHPTREHMHSLPALALVAPRSPSGPSTTASWNAHDSVGSKNAYHPRSSEDRRALESFRITL